MSTETLQPKKQANLKMIKAPMSVYNQQIIKFNKSNDFDNNAPPSPFDHFFNLMEVPKKRF